MTNTTPHPSEVEKAQPSDDEIIALHDSVCSLRWPATQRAAQDRMRFARALLARYGAQPVVASGYIHPDNVRRLEAGETVAFRKKPYAHDGGGIPVFIGAQPAASAEPVACRVLRKAHDGVWANGEECVEPIKCEDCEGLGHLGDENGGHRLVEPDHETALALADAPRSLRNYVAALRSAIDAARSAAGGEHG